MLVAQCVYTAVNFVDHTIVFHGDRLYLFCRLRSVYKLLAA